MYGMALMPWCPAAAATLSKNSTISFREAVVSHTSFAMAPVSAATPCTVSMPLFTPRTTARVLHFHQVGFANRIECRHDFCSID